MKRTDIPETLNTSWANSQRTKKQVVKTPFGDVCVDCTVRPLRLKSSIREWRIWFDRFVLPRLYDYTSSLGWINRNRHAETIKNWKSE